MTLVAIAVVGQTTAAGAGPDFARDVRPILERHCFACHGPEKQKSGYRLDVREIALKGGESGKAAILPHDADASPLIRYVSGKEEEIVMPPEKSDEPRLTVEQVATLRAWIEAGPAWPDEFAGRRSAARPHWALQPLVQPPLPRGDGHPIDLFLRAKLTAKNLSPSPQADGLTLMRRVCYDLTGLPPAPEEVTAFLHESHHPNRTDQPGSSHPSHPSPDPYETLVSRLLTSPRYGERWARHWLDTIHYADTHGFEHDVARDNAWPYRDYVIAALNRDTPWPRFIREQLAADHFFPNQPHLMPALGYLGAGTFDLSAFSTAPITFEYLDRDDLVTQTMAAFVSTTANCARCHAHKFDPISQEDYYALQSVFAGVLKGDLLYDEDAGVAHQRTRWQRIIDAADRQDATVLLAPDLEPFIREWVAQQGEPVIWRPLDIKSIISAEGTELTSDPDGAIIAGGPRPDKDAYSLIATSTLSEPTALRLEVLASDKLPMRGPGRADNGNFHLSEFEAHVVGIEGTPPRPLKLSRATADFNQTDWSIERAIDGQPDTAWGIHPAEGSSHQAVFTLAERLSLKGGEKLSLVLKQSHGRGHLIGRFRLAATDAVGNCLDALPSSVAAALARPADGRTELERVALASHALRLRAVRELAALPAPKRVFAAAATIELVNGEGPISVRSIAEPKPVNVLERGDFDKPGPLAQPGALSAVTALPARFTLTNPKEEATRRAALADWLAHPDNPLTWRSVVNRVWHYHFGRGICDTPSDFGKMGGEPSHAELLDWLAVWFRDEAHGSLKELHRFIVTSAAYRQCSDHRDDAAKIDAENRLLWRQNRQRLDADAFRDFTLAATSRLDLAMGGPGVRYFSTSKGPQATPVLEYRGFDWNSPGAGRRSIYRFVWRGLGDPFMEALDFPDLGLLAPARSFSVSSLQALALYNNDFVLENSAALARRVEAETALLDAQVKRAVALVWLREPNSGEQSDFEELVRRHGLPSLCRLLLNSNEFLFVN